MDTCEIFLICMFNLNIANSNFFAIEEQGKIIKRAITFNIIVNFTNCDNLFWIQEVC